MWQPWWRRSVKKRHWWHEQDSIPNALGEWNDVGAEYLPGLLGIEFTLVSDDEIRARMAVRKALLAWNGFLHGGSVVTLADTACGYGTVNRFARGCYWFHDPGVEKQFSRYCQGRCRRVCGETGAQGSDDASMGCDINLEGGHKTIARFRCTQLILRS